MFKKIMLICSFCLLMLGTVAFADTGETRISAPNGKDYKYYIKSTESDFIAYFNEFESIGKYFDGGISAYVYDCVYVKGGKTYVVEGSVRVVCSDANFISNHQSVADFLKANDLGNGVGIIPPVIAPTAKEAITKIIPQLSEQLKILLPIGVTILVTLLGPQLVKRLMAWFL